MGPPRSEQSSSCRSREDYRTICPNQYTDSGKQANYSPFSEVRLRRYHKGLLRVIVQPESLTQLTIPHQAPADPDNEVALVCGGEEKPLRRDANHVGDVV